MNMRKTILLLLACCLAGCADHTPPPKVVVVSDAPVADNLPPEDRAMSSEQIADLKNRLAQLKVGMSRAKVLEILDVSSFKLHTFESANKTGIVYRLKEGHVLELGHDRRRLRLHFLAGTGSTANCGPRGFTKAARA